MNYLRVTLFTATILICAIAVQAQTVVASKEGATVITQNQETKGAVDSLVEEMKNRNEPVVRGCIEPCSESEAQKAQVKVGEALDNPMPVYPTIARAAHATGSVVVSIVIDETGKVIAAQAVSGHPLLQAAAVKAAREWTFMPTLVDGRPVNVVATITYNFVMQ